MSPVVLFSLIAGALVVVALAFVLPTLLRARARRQESSRAAIHADLYRQGIEELQQEVAHGDLPASELQPARDALRGRLMDEIRPRPKAAAPAGRARLVALVVGTALPVVATVLYLAVGRPEALTGQAAVESTGEGDYVARLQAHLGRQPRDARGWVLLARAHAERDAFADAAAAFEKAVTASQKVAKDPGVLCEYADALGMAQGRSLAGKPAELVAQALAIDPKHPAALEMAGSAAYEDGRYADAAMHWKRLLGELPAGSDRQADLAAAIERAERRAAVSLPRRP